MDAINDLSSISESESFDESKYEPKTNRKHKRKHSKSKRIRDKRKYQSDDDIEFSSSRKHYRRSDDNATVDHYEELQIQPEESHSRHHSRRKHHRREAERSRGSSSDSSDSSSMDTNNRRYKPRHKHSRRHRRKNSEERRSRSRHDKKHQKRRKSVSDSDSSPNSRSDIRVKTEVRDSPNDVTTNAREPDPCKWEDNTGNRSNGVPAVSRREEDRPRIKSEPSSDSESDEPQAANSGRDTRMVEGPTAPDARRSDNAAADQTQNNRVRNGNQQNGREQWGKQEVKEEEVKIDPEDKAKPNLGLSGKLTEDANTYKGVVIKYSQPSEARKPKRRWRWYIFKGDEELPFLPLHRQSAYLIGRERRVVDVPTDHPSCSKQHAVLQYRLVRYTRDDSTTGRTVKPYIIDLESANGTYVNNRRITPRAYVELMEKDVVKFGYSSREYVLLHEKSKDSDEDNADAGMDVSPVSALMAAGGGGR